jgi:transcriptional regulator with XRE-family HTH domain
MILKQEVINMSLPIPGLKPIREQKLLTQSELASKANVTQSVISNAEAGQRISLGSIKNIAKALGVNADKLRNPPQEIVCN